MIPPIADQFVAGETPGTALRAVEEVNSNGIGGIVNLLGEHYENVDAAARDTQTYTELIGEINRLDLTACISVKPSQIGLGVTREEFEENATKIVSNAAERNVFVWFDMENHLTTDTTLDVFEQLTHRAPGSVGVCIQANLRRTYDDLSRIVDLPGGIRLTKGAYAPPHGVAFQEQETVNRAFRSHLNTLFTSHDGKIAVGTHDPAMIETARKYHERYGTEFEFQMLKGVRESTQTTLAEDYDVWQYIPFGNKWLSYFYRRIRERKGNAVFAARAIFNS
jgi:proline dehydrogenase